MIADPRAIVTGLGGKWSGRHGMCFCPAHDNSKTPALSVSRTTDGRPLVHCFAGCEQMAVIAALRTRKLWPDKGELVQDPSAPHRLTVARDPSGLDQDALKRRENARELWHRTQPITGTVAETYLRQARGIRARELPSDLRFLPSDYHHELRASFPCMVAAIRDSAARVCAVQLTYLEADGRDRIRPANRTIPAKRTRGPMCDGAVRLGIPTEVLGFAEGIETALSAKQLFAVTVWATCGMGRLASVAIPEGVRELWFFADAGDAALKHCRAAVDHFSDQGFRCLIQTPEEGFGDHNDALRSAKAGRAA